MKIFKGGTSVVTVLGNYDGIITAVSIRFDAISYEVTHVCNGEFKTIWMNENEFATTANKTTLGFK